MLQNQEELDIIGRYDKPSFGAKHLNSLAKGRNVEDSVTTGVINYADLPAPRSCSFLFRLASFCWQLLYGLAYREAKRRCLKILVWLS